MEKAPIKRITSDFVMLPGRFCVSLTFTPASVSHPPVKSMDIEGLNLGESK